MLLLLCSLAVVQASEPGPLQLPPASLTRTAISPVVPPMGAMNPSMMLRLRDQMTRELQQIQRQLGFIDPSEVPLRKTLTDMQADILTQLQDINALLKEQGISPPDNTVDALPDSPVPPKVPAIPPGDDPTLVPGGVPQPSMMPPIQRAMPTFGDANDPVSTAPRNPLPNGMMGGFVPGMPEVPPYTPMPGVPAPVPRTPAAHDQDQAWADSPWAPRPSKELAELKQTIDGLRKELGEMRETTKALETQIQLLNRHFLLMNPQK